MTPKRLLNPVQKGNKRQRKTRRKQLYGTTLLIIGVVVFVAWALYVGGK